MKKWFAELSVIDVNEHIEKKNGLSYLSWYWAWSELKKRYPLSYATVHENEGGSLIWPDPIGCHVKTSVTLVWEEEDGKHEHTVTEYLPVMDFKNKSIPMANVTSMDVNKTVQRSLTKCIARLGLGGYVYAGSDLPEEPEEVKQAKAEAEVKEKLIVADLIQSIDNESKRLTVNMSPAEKRKFAEATFVPAIGQLNYKTCTDSKKLTVLLNKMRQMKEAA